MKSLQCIGCVEVFITAIPLNSTYLDILVLHSFIYNEEEEEGEGTI